MVGGPSFVFTRKAVVDETFISKSAFLCKSFVSIDARQLHPLSMCQPMPTALYTRWNYDYESQNFMPRQNRTRSFENTVLSYFQQNCPECKIESNITSGRQKKIDCFSVDGICNRCNTVFEAMGCYFPYCACHETRPLLTDNEIMRGKKGETTPKAQRIYPTEQIQNFWNIGGQMVGSIPNWCDSKYSSSSKFPLTATSKRRSTHARD